MSFLRRRFSRCFFKSRPYSEKNALKWQYFTFIFPKAGAPTAFLGGSLNNIGLEIFKSTAMESLQFHYGMSRVQILPAARIYLYQLRNISAKAFTGSLFAYPPTIFLQIFFYRWSLYFVASILWEPYFLHM